MNKFRIVYQGEDGPRVLDVETRESLVQFGNSVRECGHFSEGLFILPGSIMLVEVLK